MNKLLIVILGCFLVLGSCEEKVHQKPNIIFLLTDDQRDNSIGAMGHGWVKTPNLDRLVNEGVRFTNTYIAEPTCSPSRVALFTGMHERLNGVGFSSSYSLTQEQWGQTYPALLRDHGYYTGFIGKFGVEYYTFKGKASEKFDFWRAHDGWARFWPKTAQNCEAYFDSEEEIITPVMGESIERFLRNVPGDKPFCLSVSFSIPHGSQIISMHPKGGEESRKCMIPASENPKLKDHPFYDTLYRNMEINIPEETGKDPYAFIPEFIMDQSKGRATGTYIYDYSRVTCKEHHIRYFQQISGLDKIIGDMIGSLDGKGLSGNTIIIFASDHGLLMGEYGMGGKALLYDLTSKIPCFIYDPRLPDYRRGKSVKNLVSSVDLTSTILDYARIIPPAEMHGLRVKPLVEGKNIEWRNEIFLENLFTGRDNPFCEGIRHSSWKYIRMYDGIQGYTEEDLDFSGRKPDFEQLFNLEDDPEEKVNLVSRYEGSELLAGLRTKCQEYSDELNNKRKDYLKSHHCEKRESISRF